MAATDSRDTADGALLLLFVDRTYGPERAAAVVAACSRFVAERERELPPDHEPERDTLPAALFWCECPELNPDPAKPELCAVCARLLRTARDPFTIVDELDAAHAQVTTLERELHDGPTVAQLKCPCGYHGPLNDDGSCPRCGADE